MNDSWDEMRRAKEEQFFEKENQLAMERLKGRSDNKKRLSPITGKEMEQLTIMGVLVDRCPDSGGVWLDAGELEQLLKTSKEEGKISHFFSSLFSRK